MLKLKNLKFIALVFIGLLSLFPAINARTKMKFTSVYTDSTKDCKGEEPVFTCKGFGGYKAVFGIGGVFSDLRIESTASEYTLAVAGWQSVGWNPKIEWRMADGKPFAVIVRADVLDENADIPKKTGEQLIIKGLQGFEHIDEAIDSKTPKANEKAREIADTGFQNKSDEAAFTDGKSALLSVEQIKNLKKLKAAVAVPTYIPAGYQLKAVEIQEPEAHIVAFSISYENAAGKSFQIQSNNEALGDMAVRREIKGKSVYFADTTQESAEFYTGRDENDIDTIASEWLCSLEKYQPKGSLIQQCFQLLSDKNISPDEAMKIMKSLRYLKN